MERCTLDTWEVLALELVGVAQEHGKVYIRHLGGACFRTGGVLHRSMERCTSDTWEVLALELVGVAQDPRTEVWTASKTWEVLF